MNQEGSPISSNRQEAAYTPPPSVLKGMKLYLYKTFRDVAEFGFEAKAFPWSGEADRLYYARLVIDKLSGHSNPDQLLVYLEKIVGKDIAAVALGGLPDSVAVVSDEQEKAVLAAKQRDEAAEEEGDLSKHAKLFLDRANMSEIMIRAIIIWRGLKEGIIEGARYGLSDRKKYDFFIKNPDCMPAEVKEMLLEQGLVLGEHRSRAILAAINEDDAAKFILDDALTKLILAVNDVGANEDLEGRKLGQLIKMMTPLEKYVARNFDWKAKHQRTSEWKRKQKEMQAPVDGDGTQAELGPLVNLRDEPGHRVVGKFVHAPIRSDTEMVEQAEALREISQPIFDGVASLASATADWLRQIVLTREWHDESGDIRCVTVTAKQSRDWLQWADILELYADICRTKLSMLLQPEHEVELRSRLKAARGNIIYKIQRTGRAARGKAIFEPREFIDGVPIDWHAPTLRSLTTTLDFTNAVAELIAKKDEIIRVYGKSYANNDMIVVPDGDHLVEQKATAEAIASLYGGVSAIFVRATMFQGIEQCRSLRYDENGIEIDATRYRGYLNHRIIPMLPGILQIVRANPKKYDIDVRTAFFTMTSVHGGIKKPVELDDSGKLVWVREMKDVIDPMTGLPQRIVQQRLKIDKATGKRQMVEVMVKRKEPVTDKATGLVLREPALNIGGRRNMFDGRRTNAEIYYEIRGQTLSQQFREALEDAGIHGNRVDQDPSSGFWKSRIHSERSRCE